MKLLIKFFVSLVCAGMLFSIINATPTIPNYVDASKTIELDRSHATFQIRLPSNPTTGYRWVLKSYEKNKLTLKKYYFESSKNHRIGSGGYMNWIFKASNKAFEKHEKSQIQLIYARPWAPNDHPTEKTFTVSF